MVEFISSSFLYKLITDTYKRFSPRRWKLSPNEILDLREKWKPIFDAEIHKCMTEKLRQDAVIHDAKRLNEYPEPKEHKGISPWFKVALLATNHRAIEVCLGIHDLVFEESENSWRRKDWDAGEETEIKSFLMGHIPYEQILKVNMDGDEYYNLPHIFCHFDISGQPYEKIVYCEQHRTSHGVDYFTEIASQEEVKLTSQKFGTWP